MSTSKVQLIGDTDALRTAVSVARFAPSLHNSQPWQWRIASGAMELFTDRSRQLKLSAPDGR